MGFSTLILSSCVAWLSALVLWAGFDHGPLVSLGLGVVIGTAFFFVVLRIRALFAQYQRQPPSQTAPREPSGLS